MAFYGPPLKKPVTPFNLIYVFDIHRVLVRRDWWGIVVYLCRMPNKCLLACLAINPFFWFKILSIWRKTSVGDEIYDRLEQAYPRLQIIKKDFIALENMQKPDIAMMAIIQSLKAQGYSLYILSNLGERAFPELAEKFPSLFNFFDHVFLPKAASEYRHKPNKEFYQDFLRYVAQEGDHTKAILFIDDRLVNIKSAANVGISAIYFKNAHHLKKMLEESSLVTHPLEI